MTNPLHVRVPMSVFRRNQWVNLAIDVFSFGNYCFKGINFRSIDLIKIQGACKLRRIFTMLSPVMDDELDDNMELQAALERL